MVQQDDDLHVVIKSEAELGLNKPQEFLVLGPLANAISISHIAMKEVYNVLMSFIPIYLTVCQLLLNGNVFLFTSESSHAVELAPFLLVCADLK